MNNIKINEIPDVKLDYLSSGNVKNVLLLNMSTINGEYVYESEYVYGDITVKGFGQLEPVPQIVNNHILRNNDKKLDLIIITASEKARDEVKRISLKPDETTIESTAVSFFKYRIRELCGEHVQFLTVDIEDNHSALFDTTEAIRKIKYSSKDDFRLYMDIHGGLRDVQLLFDAIISTLDMEGIHITEAFSCVYSGSNNEITTVTNQLHVFRFVSGMNEFINYGYGKELRHYINNCQDEEYDNEWREELADNIQKVSDALAICNISDFEEALDQLDGSIRKKRKKDSLFDIFIENIKADYGDLLDFEKRDLFSMILWARKKSFYQQALAIVEANTPNYLFKYILNKNDLEIKKINDDMGNNRKIKLYDLKKELNSKWEKDDNFILKLMFYKNNNTCFFDKKRQLSKDKKYGIFNYEDKNHNLYRIKVGLKCEFSWEIFCELGKQWWNIKDGIRNPMFHLYSGKPTASKISKKYIDEQLEIYLGLLKELDNSIVGKQDSLYKLLNGGW